MIQTMPNPFDQLLQKLEEIDAKISNIPQAATLVPPEIIDSKELCKRLNLSDETVMKWRKKKKIPYIRIGTSVRYNWPAVIEFLENKSTGK